RILVGTRRALIPACSAVPNEIKALSAFIGRIYRPPPGIFYGVLNGDRKSAGYRTIEGGTTIRADWVPRMAGMCSRFTTRVPLNHDSPQICGHRMSGGIRNENLDFDYRRA